MSKRELYLQHAKKITSDIVRSYKPEKVILFGSLANEKDNNPQDIDLLVVKDTSEARRALRAAEVRKFVRDNSIPIDILVRTPLEYSEGLEQGQRFYREVEKGSYLYEK